MRVRKAIQQQWKQPISRVNAWKAILLAILLIGVILAFGQDIFHSRFARLVWVILLLVIWMPMAEQLFKHGWRVLRNYQGMFFVGYTFFAGGNALLHGVSASWLTNIGALLIIGAGTLMLVDFSKSPNSVPPVPPL